MVIKLKRTGNLISFFLEQVYKVFITFWVTKGAKYNFAFLAVKTNKVLNHFH